MNPTVGRVVLFKSAIPHHRGSAEAHEALPALITRVHSPTCVNLSVARDGTGMTPICVTSVSFVEDIAVYDPGEYGQAWGWMPYQKAVAAGTLEPVRHAAS